MISQLNSLKFQADQELGQKVRKVIESLADQSEQNKRMLLENSSFQNIIKTQSGISDEKSLMSDLDAILKHNQNNSIDNVAFTQASQDHSQKPAAEKQENEQKVAKEVNKQVKKKRIEFGKKLGLAIDVDIINDDQNQTRETPPFSYFNQSQGALNFDSEQLRLGPTSTQGKEQLDKTISQNPSTPR